MHWAGKLCLLITGKYTLGNCRDRQKKSFPFPPPFPQKCKSWEGLVFLARTRRAMKTSGKLVKGRMQEESDSVLPGPQRQHSAERARHGPYVMRCQLPLLRKRHQITQAENIQFQFLTEMPVHWRRYEYPWSLRHFVILWLTTQYRWNSLNSNL